MNYQICRSAKLKKLYVMHISYGKDLAPGEKVVTVYDGADIVDGVIKNTYLKSDPPYYVIYFPHVNGDSGIYTTGVWKLYYEFPFDYAPLKNRSYITEEEIQQIINPYPKEVAMIAEILKRYGDWWKDDTREEHVDNLNLYPAAKEIYSTLILKEEPKPVVVEPEVPKEVEVKSFDEIVKQRKQNGTYGSVPVHKTRKERFEEILLDKDLYTDDLEWLNS